MERKDEIDDWDGLPESTRKILDEGATEVAKRLADWIDKDLLERYVRSNTV